LAKLDNPKVGLIDKSKAKNKAQLFCDVLTALHVVKNINEIDVLILDYTFL